jgi:PadR family transcriptional regulator
VRHPPQQLRRNSCRMLEAPSKETQPQLALTALLIKPQPAFGESTSLKQSLESGIAACPSEKGAPRFGSRSMSWLLLLTISRRSVSFLLVVKRKASMADRPSDLVQGTLDMLILKTLALEPIYGYGIAVRLEQMSKGVFRLNAGSLFVAFQRLQRAGLIISEWKATENSRRAKYYALTDRGRTRLNSETREWGRQVAAIAGILEAS